MTIPRHTHSDCLLLLILAAVLSIPAACRHATSPESEERIYCYTARDSTGTRAARGLLFLTRITNRVVGHWRIEKTETTGLIGPQTGSGRLEGVWEGDSLRIELRPDWRDNNAMLIGRGTELSLDGSWICSSFAGITASGTFTAPRIYLMDCLR